MEPVPHNKRRHAGALTGNPLRLPLGGGGGSGDDGGGSGVFYEFKVFALKLEEPAVSGGLFSMPCGPQPLTSLTRIAKGWEKELARGLGAGPHWQGEVFHRRAEAKKGRRQWEEGPGGKSCTRAEALLFLHGLESNPGSSLQTEEEAGLP